jgi:hypothetical protein
MKNIARLIIPLAFALICVVSTAFLHAQSNPSVKIPAGLTQNQALDGWLALFDGKTNFGWTAVNLKHWELNSSDGSISNAVSPVPRMLRTTAQFDDYELEVEFKPAAKSRGRVFLRTSPAPKNLAADCYSIQIGDLKTGLTQGSLVDRAVSSLNEPFVKDEWHRLKATAIGANFSISINGQKVVSYSDPKPLGRGYIGIQVDAGQMAFRNIRLRPRRQSPLLNGKDLTGWNTQKSLDSDFKITADGNLSVINGRGQLESNRKFADFTLSFQCKTNAANLNSGLFFRCIPGDLMNGYECQIQNGIQDGDPTNPTDCGTGGIFRRANARRVNARDQEWFAITLVATGPRISVWVNGLQVTDWVDRRKPAENPRRGYRATAGTLAIQGHDPTTDLLFRELKAKELTVRRPK